MNAEKAQELSEQILQNDFGVVQHLFSENMLKSMKDFCLLQYRQGEFEKAKVGKGIEKQRITEIRNDYILWLSDYKDQEIVTRFLSEIYQLMEYFSNFFRISLNRYEGHYAIYPPGSFYKKHLDQFSDTSNRLISCVVYLNDDWDEKDGGQLRIYHKENGSEFTDIFPAFGKIVCFRSDCVEHEVIKTSAKRFSITGWMRRDELLLAID